MFEYILTILDMEWIIKFRFIKFKGEKRRKIRFIYVDSCFESGYYIDAYKECARDKLDDHTATCLL